MDPDRPSLRHQSRVATGRDHTSAEAPYAAPAARSLALTRRVPIPYHDTVDSYFD